MNLKRTVNINNLSENQKEIAEVIGIEAFRRLAATFGGGQIYICRTETIERTSRNEEIFCKFNGYNYKELAREYNLTPCSIRIIIRNMKKRGTA